MAVNDVWCPRQFANSLENAAGKEDGPFIVVGHKLVFGVIPSHLLFEVVLVVDEVNLHPCRWDGGHFDDERVVGVVDVEVHSAKTDDLVKLVTAFIDDTKTGHKHADFAASFVDALGDLPGGFTDVAFREKRLNCLTDVKDAGLAHESLGINRLLKYSAKTAEIQVVRLLSASQFVTVDRD